MYILGGVGDKKYYNDIWVLDVITSAWSQLDVCSQKSQGRFSHTATITNLGIAIFGGCGEDERPLNELLILQTDLIACRAFRNMHNKEEEKRFPKKDENDTHKAIFVSDDEELTLPDVEELQFVPKRSFRFSSDMLHPKRRRTSNSTTVAPDQKANPEECIHPPSQQSSPSQSDCEHIPRKKSLVNSCPSYRIHPLFRQKISGPSHYPLNNEANLAKSHSMHNLSSDHPNHIKQEQATVVCNDACPPKCKVAEPVSMEARKRKNLVGAEVHGQVDGAFDSGYLMTATVNGKVFRGVLFAPGPDIVLRGGSVLGECPVSFGGTVTLNSTQNCSNVSNPPRFSQQTGLGFCHSSGQMESRRSSPENPSVNAELQGVVLTLASPGSDL